MTWLESEVEIFQLFDIDEIEKIMEETREGAEYQEVSNSFIHYYIVLTNICRPFVLLFVPFGF